MRKGDTRSIEISSRELSERGKQINPDPPPSRSRHAPRATMPQADRWSAVSSAPTCRRPPRAGRRPRHPGRRPWRHCQACRRSRCTQCCQGGPGGRKNWKKGRNQKEKQAQKPQKQKQKCEEHRKQRREKYAPSQKLASKHARQKNKQQKTTVAQRCSIMERHDLPQD